MHTVFGDMLTWYLGFSVSFSNRLHIMVYSA